MPVLEPLPGVRVVADPPAIDALVAALPVDGGRDLRLAPDEVLVIGATGVDVDDPHAIVEPEVGFVAADRRPSPSCAAHRVADAAERPALAQGAIAGVPAKLSGCRDDGGRLVVTAAAYADELLDRLRHERVHRDACRRSAGRTSRRPPTTS